LEDTTNISSLTTNEDNVTVNVNVNMMDGEIETVVEEEYEVCKTRGRKQGSKNNSNETLLLLIKEAVTKVTKEFHVAKKEADKAGSKVANGMLATLIQSAEVEYKLKEGTIPPKTIWSRIHRNNLEGVAPQRISPIKDVEPLIVEYCLQMAKCGQALTRNDVIELANELIQDTKYAEAVIDFKKKRKFKVDKNDKMLVGKTWYKGFMNRNSDTLKRGRCRVMDSNHHSWCTYENFDSMYQSVYGAMVTAGIAEKTDKPVMYDKDGKITEDESKMVGRPTNFIMKHPEYLLFVDETGCNTNQKEDKYVGGEQFILPKLESAGGVIGAATDIHFTVLCFTSATGDPVMCAVILKSDKNVADLPISWKLGIDIRKEVVKGGTRREYFNYNIGEDKSYSGGPKCTYLGKEIPCFVGCSPKASITSEMLTAMLKTLDDLNVFDRSTGIKPMVLLDGHHSRMKRTFLDYIYDPNHKWLVCLGVPYGTHIWQVADATKLNGCFKMALCKAKRIYLTFRDENKFLVTDIIPLINMAFPLSFGRKENAIKAINKRGWNPLNFVLLDHPKLNRTEVTRDPDGSNPSNENSEDNNCNVVDNNDENNSGTAVPSLTNNTTQTITINTSGPKQTTFLCTIIRTEMKQTCKKR
jgi:hypothetical protein